MSRRWYVGASVLISLGRQNELDFLSVLDWIAILPTSRDEVTKEPEATNLDRFVDRTEAIPPAPPDEAIERAMALLHEEELNGDVGLVAAVLEGEGEPVGVISEDRRVRGIANGLGADVTGTIGVVVHAGEVGRLSADAGKRIVRGLDSQGFHLTGELRETADRLIDEATEGKE